jgi:hypothetical protein
MIKPLFGEVMNAQSYQTFPFMCVCFDMSFGGHHDGLSGPSFSIRTSKQRRLDE